MKTYIDWLLSNGFTPLRKSQYQLKMDTLNIYPDTGTLCHDGCGRLPKRGLKALQSELQQMAGVDDAVADENVIDLGRMMRGK